MSERTSAGSAAEVIAHLRYKPGWSFKLGGPGRRYLCAFVTAADSLRPERERTTQHLFELPDLSGRALIRWIFDQLLLAERHESAEFFEVDGHRPFWPHHQDEGSPHDLVERWESTPWD